MAVLSAVVFANQTLTNAGADFANADTVVIGNKTYTLQAALTNVDGNVKIGASAAATLTNLFNAINAVGGVPGTDYATAMTPHTQVKATNPTATTVKVTALVPGTEANTLGTTKTSAGGAAWGAATLTTGSGSIYTALKQLRAVAQFNSDLEQAFETINP
jgi:hypothetical protein